MTRNMAGVITEQWREGGYVIDFKVRQSFGEPQAMKSGRLLTDSLLLLRPSRV
jgi:hypothetical protein